MATKKQPDSGLIDTLTPKRVCEHFGLTPQHLYNWRTRGVPLDKRVPLAKLCAEHCVDVPAEFFEPLRKLGLAA